MDASAGPNEPRNWSTITLYNTINPYHQKMPPMLYRTLFSVSNRGPVRSYSLFTMLLTLGEPPSTVSTIQRRGHTLKMLRRPLHHVLPDSTGDAGFDYEVGPYHRGRCSILGPVTAPRCPDPVKITTWPFVTNILAHRFASRIATCGG